MQRRTFLRNTLLPLLAMPLPSWAQGRTFTIYQILWRGETAVEKGFRNYLEEMRLPINWIIRNAEQDVNRVSGFLKEIRQLRPDLVYTWGTPPTLRLVGRYDEQDSERYLMDIPVVFTMVSSPESAGLVPEGGTTSGRNYTGASHIAPITSQLRAITQYRPFETLATLYNPLESNSVQTTALLRRQAEAEQFNLIERALPLDETRRPVADAIPELITELSASEPQFLYIGPDSFLAANAKLLTDSAIEHRLPTFSAAEALLRNGRALFGLVSRYENVGRLTARKAIEVLLNKQEPGRIPVETLSRFSLLLRMETARALDFYPPVEMMQYAEVLA